MSSTHKPITTFEELAAIASKYERQIEADRVALRARIEAEIKAEQGGSKAA